MKKEMFHILPQGACPNCAHKQFVVFESMQNIYLTNRDGEIIDSMEVENKAIGQCVKCGKIYKMIPTSIGFIPATRLRELLFNYGLYKIEEEEKTLPIPNPMEMNKNENII